MKDKLLCTEKTKDKIIEFSLERLMLKINKNIKRKGSKTKNKK